MTSNNMSTLINVSRNKKREKNTGYLICSDCVLGSVGYLQYFAGELGINGVAPTRRISIYRSADELFNPASMETLENKAFTIGHPENEVNIDNDAELRKGLIRNIRRDGDTLKGEIVVTNAEAIRAMRRIHCLSLGYRFNLEQEADGTYVMKDIVYNHIALVERGRSNVARVNDSATDINNLWKGGNVLMGLFKKRVTVVDEATDVQDACTMDEEETKVTDADSETEVKADDMCGAKDDEAEKVDGEVAKDSDEPEKEPEKVADSEPEVAKDSEDGDDDNDDDESEEKKADDSEVVEEKEKEKIIMDTQTVGIGNDNAMFQPKAKDNAPKEKTFEEKEMERSNYYAVTLNPHKNKDYRKEMD